MRIFYKVLFFGSLLGIILTIQGVSGTPLPVAPLAVKQPWSLPGNEQGAVVKTGEEIMLSLEVPELSVKEEKLKTSWRGIISLGLHGTADGGQGSVVLEVVDPASGEVFASAIQSVAGKAPRDPWSVIASSEQVGAGALNAFDGDPETSWHSKYSGEKAPAPHWIGLRFSKLQRLEGLSYLPRQSGFTNGVAKGYRIEVQKEGEDWEVVHEGTSDKNAVADERKHLEVKFKKPLTLEAFRFVVLTDWSGGGFGTCGEIVPLGVKLPKKDPKTSPARERIWLELAPPMLEVLTEKRFGLRIKGLSGSPIVVGKPAFCRINDAPSKILFGRSNGGQGPDKLGAGLLGFDALTEHQQTVLTVMEVHKKSPAAKAGLKVGDAIVAVQGQPLPVNNLDPGWEWLANSHEAVFGNASEEVLKSGAKNLTLTVLREGKTETLELAFERGKAFTTMDPATDPEAAALLVDMLSWLEDNQRTDGSWSGDIKRTMFASLALLATGELKHKRRVKKAIDWALGKFPEPESHGNLGFWSAGYTLTLFGEWYLQTGDKRVLKPIREVRDWAMAGQHVSKWGMPALGHGPSGLPYGEKSLVAPALHLLVGEALTKNCGIESQMWELLDPYMMHSWSNPEEGGNGSLGYNGSYKDLAEFWSRTGLYLIASHLRGDRKEVQPGMLKIMQERHPWFRNSHAYGEPGGAWGLMALSLVDPKIYQEVIENYRWWFSLAWEPGYGLHFTTPHMGAPYMGEDDLMNCIYPLVLQASKRNLFLTGKSLLRSQ
ncbi:MAG: DUF6288 domain-containing protein [Akkermansiaceae bacterium]